MLLFRKKHSASSPGWLALQSRRLGRTALFVGLSLLLACVIAGSRAMAQTTAPKVPDFSQDPEWLPRFYNPYRAQKVPGPELRNPASPAQLSPDGKWRLPLAELLEAVIENNLDIAIARYNDSMAQTDVLRAKAGQAPRGTEGARVPSGLFAGAIGAGIGGGGGGRGGGGGEGGISGIARQVFVGPRGSFDPSLSLSFSLDRTTSPLNTIRVAGLPTVTTASTALQARYTQAFTTGTSFSLGFNNQRQSSTQRFLLFNPSFTSSLNLSVNQQLLSGFGFAVTRRFQRVAENNRAVAREVFRQQVTAVVTQAQNLYWDLSAAQQRVRAAEQALAVAQRLYQDNQKQAQIGTLAPLDVIAAEAEVAARRRDLIVAQTNRQMLELRLHNLMSREMDQAMAAVEIEVADALPEPQDADLPPLEETLATALRNRPELHQAEGNIRNQGVAVQFTKNRLKPSLNIFGVLASGARGGALGDSLAQVRRFDFPEYAFGFFLSFSPRNRAAQADDMRARLDLRQAETALQRTHNQIRQEVRNAMIGLAQARAQVAAARKTVQLSEQTLDAEQKKLRAGTSTAYNVIRVQRDRLNAQLAAVQAQVNYAKARVEMDRATGVTLEKWRISLDEGLAGQLAANPVSVALQ